MGYVLGVDLGTTYTSAAVMDEGGDPHIFSLGDHEFFVPSVLVMEKGHDVVVGEAAERRAATSPESTAREFKRRLGDGTPIILDGVPYSPQALMVVLLQWVLDAVTARQGEPPQGIAVTYPANWGEYRKEILQQAVAQVGMKDLVLLTEPEAAAVEYAAMNRIEDGGTVGVYDLGGGTFDAAMLRRGSQGFELVGKPVGVEQLGGIDFDEAVFDHVRRVIGDEALDVDLSDPVMNTALHKLRRDCVLAKEALSHDVETTIPVNLPGANLVVRLTRAELEESIRPLLKLTLDAFRRSLDSSGLAAGDLSAVLLAGGSSRIPLIAEMLSEDLGRPVAVDADPKQIVALGAAIRAKELLAHKATPPAPARADSAPTVPDQPVVPQTRVRTAPVVSRASRIPLALRAAAVLAAAGTVWLSGAGLGEAAGNATIAPLTEDRRSDLKKTLQVEREAGPDGKSTPVEDGPAYVSVGGIDVKVPGQGMGKNIDLSNLEYVLVAPFQIRRVDANEKIWVTTVCPERKSVTNRLLSVPGVAGVIMLLFAAGTSQSLLRMLRRGRRPAPHTTLKVALAGGLAGLGACLVGWVLREHVVTANLLLGCVVGGAIAGVSLAQSEIRLGMRALTRAGSHR